jgi:N-acetylmuramoyl-L-alanine amidase
LGRGADVAVRLVVTATSLNIRSGPAAEFPKVAPALKRGAELVLLEPQDRWSRVAVVGATDLEGWVCNDFVTRQAATRAGPTVLSRTQRAVPLATRARATSKPAAATTQRATPVKKSTSRTTR